MVDWAKLAAEMSGEGAPVSDDQPAPEDAPESDAPEAAEGAPTEGAPASRVTVMAPPVEE